MSCGVCAAAGIEPTRTSPAPASMRTMFLTKNLQSDVPAAAGDDVVCDNTGPLAAALRIGLAALGVNPFEHRVQLRALFGRQQSVHPIEHHRAGRRQFSACLFGLLNLSMDGADVGR